MSASVDDRVVGIKFDNGAFERAAAVTMNTLTKLKESFNMQNAQNLANKGLTGISSLFSKMGLTNPFQKSTQGAADLQAAAQGAAQGGMGVLGTSIQGVSGKMVALTTVAVTALSNITNRAISAGAAFAKSFTIGPIIDGLHEYETNLKSVQTIQANTDRPLPEINGALDELNRYSDLTIYNFGEMARNIGTFTAAGVNLQTSVSAIKGIANVAALSGSSSQQAATAMYQLSQALSSGRVGLQDWNSVVNAGMGGKKLQNALAQTAVAMGEIEPSDTGIDKMGKLTVMGGSFRESIMAKPGQTSWLTSGVLEQGLAALDGRYSKAALSAEKLEDGTLKYKNAAEVTAAIEKARNQAAKDGVKYTNEQFKALQTMSDSAFNAATKVKTLGQVFDIAKETIGSGWSSSFRSIFGDLKEAKHIFTGMSNAINDVISKNALARNNLLATWKDDGGRQKMITGFRNAWKALGAVLKPISKAFRSVFPATTAEELVAFSENFKDFTKSLIIGEDTAKNLKRTFKGVFAIFSIVGQVIGGAVSAIFDLVGSLTEGSGGFLEFTAGIGVWLSKLDKALKEGESLKTFFQGIADIIKIPLAALTGLGDLLGSIFSGADGSDADSFAGSISRVGEAMSPIESIADRVRSAVAGVGNIFSGMGEKIGSVLAGIGPAIANAFNSGSFEQILRTLQVILLGGILKTIRDFMGGAGDAVTGGFFSNLNDALGSVTETMGLMQQEIKANIILKIAGALAIMAASIALLAFIPPGKIIKAMTALAVGFGAMVGALIGLSMAMGLIGAAKLPLIAAALVLLATSLAIFAGAVALMGAIPFDNIVRGLLGIAGVLFIVQKFVKALDNKGIVRSALAMMLMGVALNLMATALKIFASLSWEEMGRGLTAMAGGLVIISQAMGLMPRGMVAQAGALLILSVALNAMASALKIFATISWEAMGRGLTALAGALVIVAGAMRLMPKNMVLQAVALNAVSSALVVMAGALQLMGAMSWDAITRGLVALGGAMAILAIGLKVMSGTLSGSAALVIATAALVVLVPVLAALGSMSWETIITGLGALAGLFTVLGVAGLLLAPVIPAILGLSAAVLLLGLGLAAIGAAAMAFATAFGIVVGIGMTGVSVLAGIIGTFISSIPAFLTSFAQGLGAFADEISKHGPSFTRAMVTIIGSMLDGVTKNAPKFGRMLLTMLRTGLTVIVSIIPEFIRAGLTLIVQFLEAIDSKIGRITTLAVSIATKFMDSLSKKADKLIQSGVNLVLSLLEGVAKAINDPSNQERIRNVAEDIGKAIIDGALAGLNAGKDMIVTAARNVGGWALDAIKKILGIKSPSREFKKIGVFVNEGFIQGLTGSQDAVVKVMEETGQRVKDAAEASASEIADLTGNLRDLKKARREAEKDKNKKNDDKYDKDIKKTKKALEAAKEEQELIKATKKAMNSPEYKKHQTELNQLGIEYDRNAEKIKEYETELSKLTSERDQIQSKFNQTPDIQRNTSLASYFRNAEKEKAKVTEFNADLQQLLGMGLDRESYNKLLEEGLDAQPFINKLIAAGPAAVEAFDQSNAGLATAALDLGNNASKAMNDVGILAMEGLLAPLRARQVEIEGEMTRIGELMVKTIKKALKIKSPSRAFMEVGKHSNAGLVKGLEGSKKMVNAAAAGVGYDALDTLRVSMSKVGEAVNANMDMVPTITPVLDLAKMQKEASKIGTMLPDGAVIGQVSYNAASTISDETQNPGSGGPDDGPASGGDVINYNQYITATERPSEIAVYRGTRNQLSMKKEELKQK